MRRLLLFFLSLLLFIAAIILSRLAPTWHHTLTGEAGALLYVAAFDGFLDDWGLYDDGQLAAQVEADRLTLRIEPAGNMPFSAARPHFADFDLTVEAQALAGPLDNAYGVLFRLQEGQRSPVVSWGDLLVNQLDGWLLGEQVERSHYRFMISSDGYYSVWRELNGVERALSTWIDTPLVNQGFERPNQLRIIAQGDTFRFFINGEAVPLCIPNDPNGVSTYALETCIEGEMRDTLVDDSIASGRVGMVAQSFTEGGVAVAFDNLVMAAP